MIKPKMKSKKYRRFCSYVLFVLCFCCQSFLAQQDDPFEDNPRVYIENGHLVFLAAAHKNISFQSQFGSIQMNGVDLSQLASAVKTFTAIKSGSDGPFGLSELNSIRQTVNEFRSLQIEINKLKTKVNGMLNDGKIRPQQVYRSVNGVRKLRTKLEKINVLLNQDECSVNPCRNGGMCINLYNDFQCLCAEGWQGKACDQDIDECSLYKETTLECQNDAECVNTPGSYRCICRPGYTGIHCSSLVSTGNTGIGGCAIGSDIELCGHGQCLPLTANQAINNRTYRCVCEPGWTNGPDTPACTVDIDECALHQRWAQQLLKSNVTKLPQNSLGHVCSIHPLVQCFNTLGSFRCGPCPPGYTGNGQICWDMNECETGNGGCSLMPLVQCINTEGGRVCGPCPNGYTGDGENCTPFDYFNNNVETRPKIDATPCSINRCKNNGLCLVQALIVDPSGIIVEPSMTGQTADFRCICLKGFDGPLCERKLSPCDISEDSEGNPCKNNGTCIATGSAFYCSCSLGWTGTTCEQEASSCGGFFAESAGTIRFPLDWNFPLNQKDQLTCEWEIRGMLGKVLQVNFTRFNIRPSYKCFFDYLLITDQALSIASEKRTIGKLCGSLNDLPNKGINITSVQSDLTIELHLENLYHTMVSEQETLSKEGINSSNLIGFELQWQAVDPACGQKLPKQNHGSFSSPGYPVNYPSLSNCFWTIEVEAIQRVQVYFASIDIDDNEDCLFDYVSIYDGQLESDPLLARVCNSTVPPPILSSGPFVLVHFHSDESGHGTGFHLTYNAVPNKLGCGNLFTADQGEITLPSLSLSSDSYQRGLHCEWRIRLQNSSRRIRLNFVVLDLEKHPFCAYDYVEIFDGPNEASPKIGRYCSLADTTPMLSSGNQILVRFRSDTSNEGRGFLLRYESYCWKTFTDPSGHIHHPGYPFSFPGNTRCTYEITRPPGILIHLSFLYYYLGKNESCSTLGLTLGRIRIVEANSNRTMLGEYCGKVSPPKLISSWNSVLVDFESFQFPPSITNPVFGFHLLYTSIEVGCGGVLETSPGELRNPSSFSGNYRPRSNCSWLLKAPRGQVVRLTFNSFVLEKNIRCVFDFVRVLDSAFNEIGKFCGRQLPPTIQSLDNELIVQFSSDETVHLNGFSATYVFLNASSTCGGHIAADSGQISSPGFESHGMYENNLDCVWQVIAKEGTQIRLRFSTFELDKFDCEYDRLEIYNGPDISSPLLGKFCGDQLPPVLVSHSNRLYIRFVTDERKRAKGFKLLFDTALTGCGGLLSSPSGAIASPNYPQPYSSNVECNYVVSVSKGSALSAHFVQLEMDDQPDCSLDYVELFDGKDEHQARIGRYCSLRQVPPMISTSGSSLFVRFRSALSTGKKGFLLVYNTNCSTIVSGYRGVIESPNYPLPDVEQPNCVWKVKLPVGNRIRFVITDLQVKCEEGAQLSIEDETSDVSLTQLSKNVTRNFCGNNYTSFYFNTSKNEAAVHFQMPLGSKNNGSGLIKINTYGPHWLPNRPNSNLFRLEYYTIGCGGEFNNKPSEFIETPDYPNTVSTKLSCLWHINVRPGNRINLRIMDFDSTGNPNCKQRYLRVLGGPTADSPELARVCSSITQTQEYSSMGSSMTIQLYNDRSVTWRGFKGYFTARNSLCGGEFSFESGVIHSLNYPAPYDAAVDCVYVIKYRDLRRVEVRVLDLQLPTADNCSRGALMFYDGSSIESPLLNFLCGEKKDSISTSTESSADSANAETGSNRYLIESTGNSLTVRLRSNGLDTMRGFKLSYRSICGGHIELEQGQQLTLSSPNYPHYDRRSTLCAWTISTKLDMKLAITTTHVDSYLINPTCQFSFVSIYPGTSFNATPLAHFCSHVPSTLISSGNTITIQSMRSTFRMLISPSLNRCGAWLQTVSGEITSPQYPAGYPLGIQCDWNLKLGYSNRFNVEMLDFDLTSSDFCATDYLEMRRDSHEGPLIGRFCGSELPNFSSFSSKTKESLTTVSTVNVSQIVSNSAKELVSSGISPITDELFASNRIWIRFHSDKLSSPGRGFRMRFNMASTVRLTGTTGRIASPLHPNYSYKPEKVTYLISTNEDQLLQFDFEEVQLPAADDECMASIRIKDGFDPTSVLLSEICGSGPKKLLRTNSYQATVEYVSDGDAIFALNWSSFPLASLIVESILNQSSSNTVNQSDCGGLIQMIQPFESATIMSPGYPHSYPPSLNCTWTVVVPSTRSLQINFLELNIEGYSGICHFDRLLFFVPEVDSFGREEPEWSLAKTVCGRQSNSFNLESSHIQVRFESDTVGNGNGFRINFKSICGGRIDATRPGELTYNATVTGEQQCKWTFVGRVGRTLKLKIKRLQIGIGPVCADDYLLFRNGGSDKSPLLGKGRFCGSGDEGNLPESTGNQVSVTLHLEKLLQQFFVIFYEEVVIGCGGRIDLTDPSESIRIHSPSYPNPPPVVECTWLIRSSPTTSVRIDFDISQSNTPCSPNDRSISIFDGGSSQSPVLVQSCPRISSVSSTDNLLFVRFVSSQLGLQDAFQAQVQQSVCGGTYLISQDSYLRSKNHPRLYPSNLNCVYYLRSFKPGYNFHFSLVGLDLRNKNPLPSSLSESEDQDLLKSNDVYNGNDVHECDRAGDFVEIRDSDKNGDLLGRFCGSAPNRTFSLVSHSSQVYVLFKTDSSKAGTGFKLRIRTNYLKCGGTIQHANIGIVRSPNYPAGIDEPRVCRWTIYGELGRRVELKLRNFNLKKNLITRKCLDTVEINPLPSSSSLMREDVRLLNEGRLCDLNLGEIFTSNHHIVHILLNTKGLNKNEGFEIEYDATKEATCGGVLTNASGTVESLYFDSKERLAHLNETITCLWYIQPEKKRLNSTVSVIFDVFELPISNITSFETLSEPYRPKFGSNALWNQNQQSESIAQCKSSKLFVGETGILPLDFYAYLPLKMCGNFTGLQLYYVFRRMQFSNPTLFLQYQLTFLDRGVRFFYQTQPCGGEFRLLGNYSSPGFVEPDQKYSNEKQSIEGYPPNSLCQWTISDPLSDELQLEFLNFELESNCDLDFVEVFAGVSPESSPSLGKFCGKNIPKISTESSSRAFTVLFKSDSTATSRGFMFNVKRVASAKSCGGVIKHNAGKFANVITSPNYPNKYDGNVECVWLIEYSKNYHAQLNFIGRFDIEKSENCTSDYVLIDQMVDSAWKPLGQFCGFDPPPEINSTSNLVRVMFRSNQNVSGDGFQLKVNQICGGIFTANSGYIESPNYPNNFDLFTKCNYLIQRKGSDFILVEFLDFKIDGCPHDRLNIYKSNVSLGEVSNNNTTNLAPSIISSNKILGKSLGPYCGTQKPPEQIVNQQHLLIEFISDGALADRGFRLRFDVVACGGQFIDQESGELVSPASKTKTYFHNAECVWDIEVKENHTVTLRFEYMDVEVCGRLCHCDYVKVFDGFDKTSQQLLANLCGQGIQPLVQSRGNKMRVVFYSDYTGSHTGFKAVFYQSIGAKMGCGGQITVNASGKLQSPDINKDGKYESNLDCIWILTAENENEIISLDFEHFDLQPPDKDGNCSDYLQINDGISSTEPLIDFLCGSHKKLNIHSSGYVIFLHFRSDFSEEFRGFSLKYHAINSTCGGRILLPSLTVSSSDQQVPEWQILESPNYPQPYPLKVRCRWLFVMSWTDRVQLEIIQLNLNCSNNDYLQLSGDKRHRQPLRLCTNKNRLKSSRYIGMNGLWLTFNAGQAGTSLLTLNASSASETISVDPKGFQLRYKLLGCNQTYQNSDGFILSPNYPSGWSSKNFQRCLFVISAPTGYKLSVYFAEFIVGKKTIGTCDDNRMEVKEGQAENGKKIATFCGFTVPNPIFASSNTLQFYVQSTNVYSLYHLIYTSSEQGDGCGGNFTASSGLFTSPLYPQTYNRNQECVWQLLSSGPQTFVITFLQFQLNSNSTNCYTNYLQIIDKKEDSETKRQKRLCGGEQYADYVSVGNQLEFILVTSTNNTGQGFRIKFTTKSIELPGLAHIFSGLQEPYIPQKSSGHITGP